MKTFAEITNMANDHAQMRDDSCIPSAVEMVLKLYDVLRQQEYPEQADERLDGKHGVGFVYWHRTVGNKFYHGKRVSFVEEKFDNNLQPGAWKKHAWDRGLQLLREGVYPIYSLEKRERPGDFHSWLGIPCNDFGMQFTTKQKIGLTEKDIQSKVGPVWDFQTKTEILVVRIV